MDAVKPPGAHFRPLPLTIIDLLGIIVPGFVWLILFATTLCVLHPGFLGWWKNWANLHQNWIPLAASVIMAALIGYAFKPLAMEFAEVVVGRKCFEWILRPLCLLYFRSYGDRMKRIKLHSLRFPFDDLHRGQHYFENLKRYFQNRLEVDRIEDIPGKQLFTVCKRFIRSASSALWEESERMEAEARMSGVMLLAAIWSFVLSVVTLIKLMLCKPLDNQFPFGYWSIGSWIFLSLIAVIVLTIAFMHLREMEVSYTYVNALLMITASRRLFQLMNLDSDSSIAVNEETNAETTRDATSEP